MEMRTAYDAAAMASVAMLRGIVVFAPLLAINYFCMTPLNIGGVVSAITIITVLQPVGYAVGWIFPLTATSSLPARSACWGEFFNGASWIAAMAAL